MTSSWKDESQAVKKIVSRSNTYDKIFLDTEERRRSIG